MTKEDYVKQESTVLLQVFITHQVTFPFCHHHLSPPPCIGIATALSLLATFTLHPALIIAMALVVILCFLHK